MKTLKKWLIVVGIGTMLIHAAIVLFYPGAMMSLVMYVTEIRAGGVNRIMHTAVANAKVREVVRPSPDMFYSVCIVDVSNGPVKIKTPASKPYTSITVFASNSDNIFAINDQQEVDGNLEVLVTGPASKNIQNSNRRGNRESTIASLPTNKGIVLIRYVFTDEKHMKEINKSRQQAECQNLESREG